MVGKILLSSERLERVLVWKSLITLKLSISCKTEWGGRTAAGAALKADINYRCANRWRLAIVKNVVSRIDNIRPILPTSELINELLNFSQPKLITPHFDGHVKPPVTVVFVVSATTGDSAPRLASSSF
ncbi:hypothetical protein EVAR_24366_1 [Eumeta japonica]|uniref:Uncharacterized protein n=1 Tax=Eumeta variegata TaxID=151549 RepID=A0A4C1YDM9_EUMVA|nr:hypothetical protein EVAR_24366_1 [Eumeta japonica]